MKKNIWNSPKKTCSPCFFSFDRKVFQYYLKEKMILLYSKPYGPLHHHFRNIFVGSKTASQILDSMFFNPLLISNFWRNFFVIFSFDCIISFIVATIDLIITTYYRLDNQKPTDFAQEMEINTKWIQNIFPNILTKVFSGHFWSFQNIKSKMLIF